MTNPKDEIARLLEAAEQEAYKRGWNDAMNAMVKVAENVKDAYSPPTGADVRQNVIATEPRKTGRPSSNTIEVVEDCINAAPGQKGVDVVKAAQLVDPSINERTVRTCLRRLKLSKKIWQRNGLWYPKPPRVRLELDHDDEEANSSPPHQ